MISKVLVILNQALSLTHSYYLSGPLWFTLALSRSLWFTLALSRSFWLTLALSGAHRLSTKFLLSSIHRGRVATVYPALVVPATKRLQLKLRKSRRNCPIAPSGGARAIAGLQRSWQGLCLQQFSFLPDRTNTMQLNLLRFIRNYWHSVLHSENRLQVKVLHRVENWITVMVEIYRSSMIRIERTTIMLESFAAKIGGGG